MSGYNNESDFYGDEPENNSGGGLRDYIKKLEETNKNLQKLLDKDAEKTVTDLLKDKGLDPAVAQIIPQGVDAKEWLEANGKLFVASVPAHEQERTQPAITEVQQDDPAVVAEKEAREQMLAAQEAGTPVTVTQTDIDRVAGMSPEDLLAEIKKAQAING